MFSTEWSVPVSFARRTALPAAAMALLLSLGCSPDGPAVTEASLEGAPVTSAASRRTLDVSVALSPDTRGDGPVMARVSVTNRSAEMVQVPDWQLPSEDLELAQFVVLRDGQPVTYAGPHIKRGAVRLVEIVSIAPGATLTYDIELSRAYDLSRDGRYTVEFVSRGTTDAQRTLRSSRQTFQLAGRTASLTSSGPSSLVGPASAATVSALAGLLTYTKCTVTQQTQLATAVTAAATYAAESKAYLASATLGSRYTKWFGTATTANVNTVKANFTAIDGAFATKPITVDCGCKKTYFAYVYPSQPYKIYVCQAFWKAALTGTDSRAGTLIHEMSHFTAVAGTDDWVYGQSGAASLAISNPLRAIDNADNHEYFAENTPKLP